MALPAGGIDPFAYLDCMYYKAREGSSVMTRAVYNILGVSQSGTKDLTGMYLSGSQRAKFLLLVLTDLKSRDVEDILIACTHHCKHY